MGLSLTPAPVRVRPVYRARPGRRIPHPDAEDPPVLTTPFNALHKSLGARMVDFAGWEMPLLYTGILDEHRQVRASGGLFDVSHMGRVWVKGRDARRFLERLCTRRISDMQPGQCRYSLVCNEAGGVRDDVLVYRLDDAEFVLVVNAANREKLLAHFDAIRGDLTLTIDDRTLKTAMIALQGPKVIEIVARFSEEIAALKRYRFATKGVLMVKAIVSRTGYTGEDGVEAIVPASVAPMGVELLKREVDITKPDAIIRPAGLGARDTLRLEAGMPLYGHELGEDVPAWASGLSFAISLDKADAEPGEPFIGMDAVREQAEKGTPRTLVGLTLEGRRSARQGMAVMSAGRAVGVVTSACLSPTLDRPIAMAYVERDYAEPGAALTIDAGGREIPAAVTPLPFYKRK